MRFEKGRTDQSVTHPLFSVMLVFFIFTGSTPGTESARMGGAQYDRLMSEHPAPQLTHDAWQTIFSGADGSKPEITTKLHVTVVKGKIRSVGVKPTTGFKFVEC